MTATRQAPRPVSWQPAAVVVLTVGLLWLFFRNVNYHEIGRAVGRAHPAWLGAAVLVTLQTYVLRACRWQALLLPLGRARFRTALRSTVIGFTATFLLPGRVGEVLKPYLLARREGFKIPATFATVIVERLLDLTTVLLLFACALPFVPGDVGTDVKWAGGLAAAASLVGLLTLFMCAGHPERLGRWAGRVTRWLPERAARAAGHLVRTFAEGLAVMRRPGPLVLAEAWTILLWLSIALGIWITSAAFDLTFSFAGTFLVVTFLVVGVAAPTPGSVGGFHYFYLLAVTRFFGANPDTGAAAALVLHLISNVPVTVFGLIFMSQEGLTLRGLKTLRQRAQAEETA